MKKLTYILFIICSLFVGLIACDRENLGNENPDDKKAEGQLNFASFNLAVDVTAATTRTSVNTDSYIIAVYDRENENKEVASWTYSELPEIFSLKVGNYSIAAYSHEEVPAEFENPFYYGTQDFIIEENKITEIEKLECVLTSIMVTVEYDEELAALLGNDVVATVTIGEGTLEYKNQDSRAGYFQSAGESNILTSVLTGTVDDEEVNISTGFPNVKAGQHRIVKYSLDTTNPGGNGQDGSVGVSIKIDVTCLLVEEDIVVDPGEEPIIEEPGDGEGPEDPDPGPEPEKGLPVIEGNGFDIADPLVIPEGTTEENPYHVSVTIEAEKGITNLYVNISSTNEDFIGSLEQILPSNFDLAYPGDLDFDSLGLPAGDKVIGATLLDFDVTTFTPLLANFQGTHSFEITVRDNAGKEVAETLVLIAE